MDTKPACNFSEFYIEIHSGTYVSRACLRTYWGLLGQKVNIEVDRFVEGWLIGCPAKVITAKLYVHDEVFCYRTSKITVKNFDHQIGQICKFFQVETDDLFWNYHRLGLSETSAILKDDEENDN